MLKDCLLVLSSLCLIEKAYPQCSGTTEALHVGYTTESISPPGYQSSGYGKYVYVVNKIYGNVDI